MPELSPALYRAGAGEPLVLIHGFTATWRCWLPVLGLLVAALRGDRADAARPRRRAGLAAGRAHTLAQAADHFESLLDGLGVGTAHLAGNSMGGALALELAKRGRARSVVAISPGGGWEEDDAREVERIIRLFKRTQTRRARDRQRTTRSCSPGPASAGSGCAT